jgi:hypothetical protein
MLKQALRQGYKITNFRDYPKVKNQPKIILLRHDIDYSPQRAFVMAKIEKDLGIKSTYFVRVHGEYYHPFDRQSYLIIKQIIEFGHEIGLHSEARSLARAFKIPVSQLFCMEKEILERVFDLKVISAAEHADLGRSQNYWQKHLFTLIDKKKGGIKFFPQQFSQFKYLSDSLGRWREGCLCQHLEKYAKIQVLAHPDWWGPGAKKEIKKLIKANPLVKAKNVKI